MRQHMENMLKYSTRVLVDSVEWWQQQQKGSYVIRKQWYVLFKQKQQDNFTLSSLDTSWKKKTHNPAETFRDRLSGCVRAALFYRWCPASPLLSFSCKQSHSQWTLTGLPGAWAQPQEASVSPPWQSGGTKHSLLKTSKSDASKANARTAGQKLLCPAGVSLTLHVCQRDRENLPLELRCEQLHLRKA